MLRRKTHPAAILAALGLSLALAGSAGAATITLNTEFDDGVDGLFATIVLTEESSGALLFDVWLESALGSEADLHELYFNFVGDLAGLTLTTLDDVVTDYSLDFDPSVAGGAGSSFEVGVSFGNGAGDAGNGVLQHARFSLSADRALSFDDLLEESLTSAGIAANLAAHVQGTSLVTGSSSETVGGLIEAPEPRLVLLAGLALGALTVRGRRSHAAAAQAAAVLTA